MDNTDEINLYELKQAIYLMAVGWYLVDNKTDKSRTKHMISAAHAAIRKIYYSDPYKWNKSLKKP